MTRLGGEAAPGGRAGDDALLTATLRASADGDAVAERALEVFARADGVTVGGGDVAGLQIGETVSADLGHRRSVLPGVYAAGVK